MKVTAMISIIPIGAGLSLSPFVAACERVFAEAGLEGELHAHGTNVEGEWDVVMGAVRRALEVVHEMGAPRISTHLKLGTRTDKEISMDAAVRSVRSKLEEGGE
jgi:uncharacterized protein (TIGR00106 family)